MMRRAELHYSIYASHIMGMPAVQKRRWSAADVRALMDDARAWPRYELLDGELLVTNAPSVAHQIAVAELLTRLGSFCEMHQVGLVLASPADLELRPESITQPDLFVVPTELIPDAEPLRWSDVTALRLAVEVLSPSTMRADRVQKRDFYMSARVEEYWIVDLDGRLFERWTPASTRPEILRDELRWQAEGCAAAFQLEIPAFFLANRGLKRIV